MTNLEIELIKLISQRLGINGAKSFSKLMSQSSEGFLGGEIPGESIKIVCKPYKYETHSDIYLSIKISDSQFYVGFSILCNTPDSLDDIVNPYFVQQADQKFILLSTLDKLNIAIFIEQLGNFHSNISFVPTIDNNLLDFKDFYESLFPES